MFAIAVIAHCWIIYLFARFRSLPPPPLPLLGNGAARLCVSLQSADENGDNSGCDLETSLEERIEELLHRLRIEAAVVAGAKNVIRILQNNKVPDKKALQEVSIIIRSAIWRQNCSLSFIVGLCRFA